MASTVITRWEPENKQFWEETGKPIAKRNLLISIPALTLAFAVWMVWSVVVVNLPNVGFKFSTNQLFWLASLPALCGATLRIFYSFAVPIFELLHYSFLPLVLDLQFRIQQPRMSFLSYLPCYVDWEAVILRPQWPISVSFTLKRKRVRP